MSTEQGRLLDEVFDSIFKPDTTSVPPSLRLPAYLPAMDGAAADSLLLHFSAYLAALLPSMEKPRRQRGPAEALLALLQANHLLDSSADKVVLRYQLYTVLF